MRKHVLLSSIAIWPLLCGCAELQRPVTDAALGAGGAYLGDRLSGGNPAAIAGGAAGGVLLGEGVQAWKSRSQKNGFNDGYTHGRSDGVKQLYWGLQEEQRARSNSDSYRLLEVTIPEHWEDGVLVKETKRIIRAQE